MRLWVFCVLSFLWVFGTAQEDLVNVSEQVDLMDVQFQITVVAKNETLGQRYIQEAITEIRRINSMISSSQEDSETLMINSNSGIQPVKVSRELFSLIEKAKAISERTQGAFDISYAALDSLWRFNGSMRPPPSSEALKLQTAKVGYQNIVLDKAAQTVFLAKKGMRIAFDAIGKGYVVDRVKALLISKDVPGGLINASGDLTTWGTRETGEKWVVGIESPLDPSKVLTWVPIIEASAATSGGNTRYFMYKGEKYQDHLDPRTGYPSKGIQSVSVFAKNAALCDALATAVFVLGKDEGLQLIDQWEGVEGIVIDDGNKVYKSSGISLASDHTSED